MPHPWRAYQEEVAAFFQSLGLTACTEAEIQGARATHRVDVVVSFALLGVKLTWIVECKLWGKPVSKEKVLALHQVAQDVGADRAFLMSENSFQPGAVAAARSTNISLTSLADLRETARADLAQLQLRTVMTRLVALERLARSGFIDEDGNVRRTNPKSFDESIGLAGCCLFLERAAVRGLAGEFPVYVWGVDTSKTEEFDAAPDLAVFLLQELETIEQRLSKLDMSDPDLAADTASFMQSVRSLLDSSEEGLARLLPSDKTFEAKRYECLALMKAVGRSSELLRSRGKQRFQKALRAVMRHLIDTVYLDLTKPSVTEARWLAHREGAERHLAELQSAIDEERPLVQDISR